MCHQPKISQIRPFTPSLALKHRHGCWTSYCALFYHCSNENNPPLSIFVVLIYLFMHTSWLLAHPILTDFHYSEDGRQK